tara:strand:- start:3827 stop:6022 length:2196 start_codon:yes stop_codon:yes gene_type:complete
MTVTNVENIYQELIKIVNNYLPEKEILYIKKALDFAHNSHQNQKRISGDPFIIHPVYTAIHLANMKLDSETIQAALLHDVIEDCGISHKELSNQFNKSIANLVDGVTKLKKLDMISTNSKMVKQYIKPEASRSASLRKMLVAMAEDIRVVLIKLADRLHNMETLEHLSPTKRKRISRETLDIYSPIAHRLGMNEMKWKLEDFAFRYLNPDSYKATSRLVNRKRIEREKYTSAAIKSIEKPLIDNGIQCFIDGRVKNLYSTHNKLQKYKNLGKKFDEIYDLIALRVICDNEKDCYAALGIVHSKWRPVPGQFDDYIATPKENMYQALHTSVRGPGNYPIEVQIKTKEMHIIAEEGVASHWVYKETKDSQINVDEFEKKMSWLRRLLDWHNEMSGDEEYLNNVKNDILKDQVFVYTPKGDVKDLPTGATSLDFAYRIHTDLGHDAVAAIINGKISPLNSPLSNGDVIEIKKSKSNRGPSLDWLNKDLRYLITGSAQTKVRQWFRKQERETNIERGKDIIKREIKRLDIRNFSKLEISKNLDFENFEELSEAVGIGQISIQSITELINPITENNLSIYTEEENNIYTNNTNIFVMGDNDFSIDISKCCNPIYGEEIIGYQTDSKIVIVHSETCRTITQDPEKFIPVAWKHDESAFPSRIEIHAYDRLGLIRDITDIVSSENINIHSLVSQEHPKNNISNVYLTVYTTGVEQLSRLFSRIETIPGVNNVFRVYEK